MLSTFVPDPGELRQINFIKENTNDIGFALDLDKKTAPLRPMHGLDNYAPIQNAAQTCPTPVLEMLNALKVPYCYLHDAPLENAGWELIDVSRIFPLFNADENDPANYLFGETDTYLQRVVDAGAEIIFRLGESIELNKINNKYIRVAPPKDYDKWARICLNIVRHYNEGWADGYHWNIKDWSVWEEPNNPNLWAGTFEEYLKLYEVISKKFKAAFPDLHIGGPATTTLGYRFLEEFLAYCREKDLPLDFVCYTAYYHTPAELLAESFKRREAIDKYGYTDIPMIMDEWHGSPVWQSFPDAAGYKYESDRIRGFDGAVFAGTILCGLQDSRVAKACYYSVSMPGGYGLFDERRLPTPQYYMFERYASIFNNAERRIALELDCEEPNVKALATFNNSGDIEILFNCYLQKTRKMNFTVPDGYKLEVIETMNRENPVFSKVNHWEYTLDDATLSFKKTEYPASFYIRLTPVK